MNWGKHLEEIMSRTEFMALSTEGEDGVWVCPVQFSFDETMNLYFKSKPRSKHMQNVLRSPSVAVAIYSTNRLSEDDVAGIQIRGSAVVLGTHSEINNAAKYHYGRSRPDIDYRAKIEEHLGNNAEWNFVKIIPTEVWCFDTRHFDEERRHVPMEEISLTPTSFKR